MPKFISVALVMMLSSVALPGSAQQTAPAVKNVPIRPTPAGSGQQMFASYCAVCHGPEGRGNGPAAFSLKTSPADLTVLSQKNGGVFPANHVNSVLRFGIENPAHGSAVMPIWGNLFETLHPTSGDEAMQARLRITNLTNYLQTIQQK
jgi:mono/diheme cytochrome c family protein